MIKIKENVPLAPLTTFEIGGLARYFTDVRNEEELQAALALSRERGLPFVILSGGSNVLVPDRGIDGLVIHIVSDSFSFVGDTLSADAGCNLLSLIRAASGKNLGGWEKLAGIPGTIGGAVRGNAGAFGPEIKDFVMNVRALNSETGEVREFANAECSFSYRQSFFKQNPEWIITRVSLNLRSAARAESERLIEKTIEEREKRHIQNVRAAGSFFVNPVAPRAIQEMFEQEKKVKSREGRVPAGWLIEKAGMKGVKVGGAIASPQHPNYIVNIGSATAENVRELAEKVRQAVQSQFGVHLQEEAVVM